MLGLLFENLVIGNLPKLLDKVGFGNALLKSAAPYRQVATNRRKGCQVDLLLQALALGKDVSVRTALVYAGELSKSIEADGYFDYLVPVESLMASGER